MNSLMCGVFGSYLIGAFYFSYNKLLENHYMRKKEGLADYHYFLEPDLPGISISQDYVDCIHTSLPELQRYENMGFSMQDVLFLTNYVNVGRFFDATIAEGADIKLAANWIVGDIAAYMKNE